MPVTLQQIAIDANWLREQLGIELTSAITEPQRVIGNDDTIDIFHPGLIGAGAGPAVIPGALADQVPGLALIQVSGTAEVDGLPTQVMAYGTGFFIAPDRLVTAAHVLTRYAADENSPSVELTPSVVSVSCGYKPGNPFAQWIKPAGWEIFPQWQANPVPGNDAAVVKFSQPRAGRTFTIAAPGPGAVQNKTVNIMGYRVQNRIVDSARYHALRVISDTNGTMQYDVDTFPGQSGAPVILWDGEDSALSVVGIHCGYNNATGHNLCTRIGSNLRDWILEQ